jgi:mxaJ protein
MSSASSFTLPIVAALTAFGVAGMSTEMAIGLQDERPASELRVCADPNNLPYSNEREQGFENALAQLIAADLHRSLRYTWWPQRRGFIRETLQAGRCDVVMGIPTTSQSVRLTQPYYRSSFMFVTRRDAHLPAEAFDDAHLRRLRIGVHVVGGGNDVPPAHALAARGMVANVRGYSIYGDYSKPHPPSALIEAVARGEIDVAVVWGPLAGYFARRQPAALDVEPIPARFDTPFTPMAFDISIGVRRADAQLQTALNEVLKRRREDTRQLLQRYDVPVVTGASRRFARSME